MKPLGKDLLGYAEVEMDYYKVNKSYIRDFFGSDEKIRIQELLIITSGNFELIKSLIPYSRCMPTVLPFAGRGSICRLVNS